MPHFDDIHPPFDAKKFAAMQRLAFMAAQAHSQRGGLEIMSTLINVSSPWVL